MGFLQKYFIPHHNNNFHPHATRYYALFAYALIFLTVNFFVFPNLGITSGHALASNLDTDELISLANKERKARGLGNLTKNSSLTIAANAKGNDMFAKQYWAHIGPNGETPWQFIKGAGYNYIYAGENLAKDFSTSLETHLAWMNSATHRANILNVNYREIGIAVVSGQFNGKPTTIIIVEFGSREYGKPNVIPNTAQTSTPTPTPLPTRTIEEYRPTIIEPADNSIFNTTSVKISGKSEEGNTVKIFSNDKVIGELPKDQNNFTVNVDLLEQSNEVYIKSKDSTSGRESLNSNLVNVRIDTTPPDAEKVFVEIFEENDQITLVAKPSEQVASIDAQLGSNIYTLGKKDEEFFTTFRTGDYKIVDLFFYDEVGNVSNKEISLETTPKNQGSIPSYVNSTSSPTDGWSSFLPGTKLGTREKINLIMTTIFLMLIAVDAVYMLKKGQIREWSSHHGFSIALIVVLFVGILTI